MVKEFNSPFISGNIYLISKEIVRYYPDGLMNPKKLCKGTPVVFMRDMSTSADEQLYLVQDYAGELWNLPSKEYLTHTPIKSKPRKKELKIYKKVKWIFLFSALLFLSMMIIGGITSSFIPTVLGSLGAIISMFAYVDQSPTELLYSNEENLRELEILLSNTEGK